MRPSCSGVSEALQHYLDSAVITPATGIQLTYKDDSCELSVASGRAGPRAVSVNDTWLFGSGTKPVTSAIVLKRVEDGSLGLNDTVAKYLDQPFRQKTGQTFLHMFGANATNLTIWHLLTMQAGLPDFDVDSFDRKVLDTAETGNWTPLDMVQYAATQSWLCRPGQCVFYSSTNYILLGFVLLALDGKGCDEWAMLQQVLVDSFAFERENFLNHGSMNNSGLTVPGRAALGGRSIYTQPANILGWTCGNLMASTLDMARFFWELLIKRSVLSESSLHLMMETRDISFGFGRVGNLVQLRYGAGLMTQQSDYWQIYHSEAPWTYGDWGTTIGHGGDTFGFASDQGYIPQLNATFSWAANSENPGEDFSYFITCNIIKLTSNLVLGKPSPPGSLHCDYPVIFV